MAFTWMSLLKGGLYSSLQIGSRTFMSLLNFKSFFAVWQIDTDVVWTRYHKLRQTPFSQLVGKQNQPPGLDIFPRVFQLLRNKSSLPTRLFRVSKWRKPARKFFIVLSFFWEPERSSQRTACDDADFLFRLIWGRRKGFGVTTTVGKRLEFWIFLFYPLRVYTMYIQYSVCTTQCEYNTLHCVYNTFRMYGFPCV